MKINVSKLYWGSYDRETKLAVLKNFGLPDDTLVHASHCKVEIGCKYGGPCPVCDGRVKQIFDYDPTWD